MYSFPHWLDYNTVWLYGSLLLIGTVLVLGWVSGKVEK